ncbi:MAG TPA: hypothetical protein VK454_00465 [Myxococcaceae bacterium]|nr:hypothetical protein [Myxococcaceae bacterium]
MIRELKAAVAAGALEQILDPAATAGDATIGNLSESGPWSDYLELWFQTPGRTIRYRLSVETYHGAGGTYDAE